jgi:hypothetical protein
LYPRTVGGIGVRGLARGGLEGEGCSYEAVAELGKNLVNNGLRLLGVGGPQTGEQGVYLSRQRVYYPQVHYLYLIPPVKLSQVLYL